MRGLVIKEITEKPVHIQFNLKEICLRGFKSPVLLEKKSLKLYISSTFVDVFIFTDERRYRGGSSLS